MSGTSFPPGTYIAEIPCSLRVIAEDGSTAQDEFGSPLRMTIDEEGGIQINESELVVGQEVVRSIPTADLAFEVVAITRMGSLLSVEYEPRPTLPGITIEGELRETYRSESGSIHVESRADLLITDVSTVTTFTADCQGNLVVE